MQPSRTGTIVQHTPGPWHTDGSSVYWRSPSDGNNWLIAQLVEPPVRPSDEVEANARLIAAAPDLLAGCQALIELFDYYRSQGVFGERTAYNPHMSHKFDIARGAIAKAEGRES